ncbi:leucine efflux protein LeuE [Acinetobacter gerneri]|uniref:Leucine efflux protein LeuE n=1 Tax=Acinetobacter gerneri TaxID=202952 RepID=A0AAW8JFG8_9GAMM|nr:leucine efflux protein LeuE [Acinetobacter gerneri]MDQ9008201.1 leucine efflux protein LeuE [Acinetobacter gerneri]MDQ9012385.1 leucine efflux protein LeuE [Acinetobacter gerneri]MDQ9023740.1 leucine efflux protein LeuE [Acinetobacter gerneri]MDQ9051298.1 leucine efflux protein LeuE [Acinetobacter gerneri]MDQ9058843.1 leucine efflux protein LeuE [Acinetobacter gerneri]
MFGITDIATYIIGTIFIVILPGPNSLYVMSIASRFGIKAGYLGAFGVFTGDLILILCTVLGAASLLHAFPWLFVLLKVVGAAYLSYLGIKLLIACVKTWQHKPQKITSSQTTQSLEQAHPYRTALTISILNPKAIFFYLSFFVQFVDPNYPYPALSFAALSVILQIISLTYLTILIFSGVKLANFFNTQYKIAAISVACVGILFCGFGLKLATSTL